MSPFRSWLTTGFLLPLALALLPSIGHGAMDDEYEVVYFHTIRNRTNAPLQKVRVYLTVPPSGTYQQIAGFRVERFGSDVHISNRTDEYGNRMKRVEIAQIPAHGEVTVGFSCVVTLADPPSFDLQELRGADLDEVPPEIRARYTRGHSIFGLVSQEVQEHAQELLVKYPDPADRIVAIHDLIAGTFRYRGGDGWDAAPRVLERKSGSCSEFTYAFCALGRATGIPTRMVGASIFPSKSKAPYRDSSWHRWAEVYLPGSGWIPVDVTLDRSKPPKHTFLGSHHGRTLIVSRKGDRSTQLGLSYVSSNSHSGQTTRARVFTWSVNTRLIVETARQELGTSNWDSARQSLTRLIQTSPGTLGALRARDLLDKSEADK